MFSNSNIEHVSFIKLFFMLGLEGHQLVKLGLIKWIGVKVCYLTGCLHRPVEKI